MKTSITILAFAVLMSFVFSARTSAATEGADDIANAMNSCGYDPNNPSEESRHCVAQRLSEGTGVKDPKVATCIRFARTYKRFASARDGGASLDSALHTLDLLSEKMQKEIYEKTGKMLDLTETTNGAKNVMRYVYRHPDKSPQVLYNEQFTSCIMSHTK